MTSRTVLDFSRWQFPFTAFNPSFPHRMLDLLIAAGWLIAGISAYYDVSSHRDSIAFAHLLWTGKDSVAARDMR